jgi:hypothetical protein
MAICLDLASSNQLCATKRVNLLCCSNAVLSITRTHSSWYSITTEICQLKFEPKIYFSNNHFSLFTKFFPTRKKVNFFLYDPDSAFRIKPSNKNGQSSFVMRESEESVSSVIIQPGEQVSFTVTCHPKQIQAYQGSLQMTVTDNQFEDTMIQLIGEGYMEDVIFENLHSLASNQSSVGDVEEEVVADEDVAAIKANSISFGDVYVNERKQLLFTMKNQSKTDCYRLVFLVYILNNSIKYMNKFIKTRRLLQYLD